MQNQAAANHLRLRKPSSIPEYASTRGREHDVAAPKQYSGQSQKLGAIERMYQRRSSKMTESASAKNVYTPAQSARPARPDTESRASRNAASPSKIYHADLLSSDMISDDQQEARRLGGTIAEGGGPGRLGRGSCSPCPAGCRGTLRSSSVFQETLWSRAPCACIADDSRARPAAAARRPPWHPPRAPREQL